MWAKAGTAGVDDCADCGSNALCANYEEGYNCTCKADYSSNEQEIFNAGPGFQCSVYDKKLLRPRHFWPSIV